MPFAACHAPSAPNLPHWAHLADVFQRGGRLQAVQQVQRTSGLPSAAVQQGQVEAGLGHHAHQRRQHLHRVASNTPRAKLRLSCRLTAACRKGSACTTETAPAPSTGRNPPPACPLRRQQTPPHCAAPAPRPASLRPVAAGLAALLGSAALRRRRLLGRHSRRQCWRPGCCRGARAAAGRWGVGRKQ